MTKTGGKRHMKRAASPTSWKINRKGSKFVSNMRPGPHSKGQGMPLIILLRDILGVAQNRKEVKYMLNKHRVEVDGRIVTDIRFSIGHMDVLHFTVNNKYYRIQYHRSGKLLPFEIDESEAYSKIAKIIGKRTIRGNKFQISLHDGRNILLDANDSRVADIKVNGSLKITLPTQEIEAIYPLQESSSIMVTEGNHQGKIGRIVEINHRIGNSEATVSEEVNGELHEFVTALKYAFVLGDKAPAVTVQA